MNPRQLRRLTQHGFPDRWLWPLAITTPRSADVETPLNFWWGSGRVVVGQVLYPLSDCKGFRFGPSLPTAGLFIYAAVPAESLRKSYVFGATFLKVFGFLFNERDTEDAGFFSLSEHPRFFNAAIRSLTCIGFFVSVRIFCTASAIVILDSPLTG